MTYRDLAEAAEALYGESRYGMHTARPNEIGGPMRELDDLAEAWLRGDHVLVLAAEALRVAKVRARTVIVKPVSKKRRILELRKSGWTTREISTTLNTNNWYVALICRRAGLAIPRASRKVNPSRLAELRSQGLTQKQIAELEGLSRFTVCRILRGKQ